MNLRSGKTTSSIKMKLRSGKIISTTNLNTKMKLRNGKILKDDVFKPKHTTFPYEFSYKSIVLYENGKRFVTARTSVRDWHLHIDNKERMMLILHNPCTQVDYFSNNPVKISYNDDENSVFIQRPFISYTFEFKDDDEYTLFKNLKMEEYYNFD